MVLHRYSSLVMVDTPAMVASPQPPYLTPIDRTRVMVPRLLVWTAAHICQRCFLRVGSPAIVSSGSICGMAYCACQVWPAAFLRLCETLPSYLACHIRHSYLFAGYGWTCSTSVSTLCFLGISIAVDKEKRFRDKCDVPPHPQPPFFSLPFP